MEVLLVMSILGGGLSAMLKIHAYNEVIWYRMTHAYCSYLRDSEQEARESLQQIGVETDWDETWLQGCQ